MEVGLIANPEGRRYELFCAAAKRYSVDVRRLSWTELLGDPSSIGRLGGTDWVRIESPGKDRLLAESFALLGGSLSPRMAYGEIKNFSEVHTGLCRVLVDIGAGATDFGFTCINPPADIAAMFDKAEAHRRFAAAGIPRPMAFVAPTSCDALQERLSQEQCQRWFLKPLYGSSASGVCAYRWHPRHRQLIAPIELERTADSLRLYNTRRIRTHTNPADIDAILSALLPHGMICESWLPKATLQGVAFDFRVLVIAGEARHTVLRQSRHPMTNLHLGSQRGSLDSFVHAYGESALEACHGAAVRAAECFPASLYCGVDVLVMRDGSPYVLEANAFGDLLPNVFSRGQSTYEAILESTIRKAYAA
ncbi:MAG: STM4014 family protein [Thermoanaerobaculia bacterium]|nr:STM4014 family protein [Thermoanaerobaculia bacterium]